jgi:hypothetical protein
MTASKRWFTAGRFAEASSHRRASPTGSLPGSTREPARGRDIACLRGFEPAPDPDGEAGRGRLGQAY